MIRGKGETDEALELLVRMRDALLHRLEAEPAWHGLLQLEAQRRDDSSLTGTTYAERQTQYGRKLDELVPEWRQLEGLCAAVETLGGEVGWPTLPRGLAADGAGPPTPSAAPSALRAPARPGDVEGGASPGDGQLAERNRSLIAALGTLQGLSGATVSASSGTATVAAGAGDLPETADAVLGRIRSRGGEQSKYCALPPMSATLQPGSGTSNSPAGTTMGASRRGSPPATRTPVSDIGSGAASGPATVTTPSQTGAGPGVPPQAQERLDAIEAEIETLLNDGDEAARVGAERAGLPDRTPVPSTGEDPGDRDPRRQGEAEVEIVPLSTVQTADVAARFQPTMPLSERLQSLPPDLAEDHDRFAAYRDLIDEASVEIVHFDEAGEGSGSDANVPDRSPSTNRQPRTPVLRVVRDT